MIYVLLGPANHVKALTTDEIQDKKTT